MTSEISTSDELQQEYLRRFGPQERYRDSVWKILTRDYFQQFIPPAATLLDMGSGWGQFVNHIQATKKYAMDLNPDGARRVAAGVEFFLHNCADVWPLADNSLDLVFTSNFLEHLPCKRDLSATLAQAYRCLRPGGSILCMGPNIRFVPGEYWDFWDHHIPLSDRSLTEVLELEGFRTRLCHAKFLPYTMVNKKPTPLFLVRWYLKMPWLWRWLGKQFLILACKESRPQVRKA